jgi:hypothetical protein
MHWMELNVLKQIEKVMLQVKRYNGSKQKTHKQNETTNCELGTCAPSTTIPSTWFFSIRTTIVIFI